MRGSLAFRQEFAASMTLARDRLPRSSAMISLHTGSGVSEQDGGLIGAEEKVINSKNKVDENMVSTFSFCIAHFLLRLTRASSECF